jgi:Flp pilus assembly protein TadD
MRRLLISAALALAASAVYLVAFPTATLYYEAIVVFHILGGAGFVVFGIPWAGRLLRGRGVAEKIGWLVFLAGGGVGGAIIFTGARRSEWPILYTHEILSALACAILLSVWIAHRSWLRGTALRATVRVAGCLALVAAVGYGAWWVRTVPWQRASVIRNPSIAPASMDDEGGGPKSPFFPSSAETNTGKVVPEDYFMDSATCKQCHADIYKEWDSSAHHYSSFNNQWYRQAIVYMQQVDGVQASKWCAGCHDAALFFPGNFNTPIEPRVHSAQANVGISCVVCHSIRKVNSTMGNGDFILEYPALQKLVASKNPYLRKAIDFLIEENPEPHRRTFLRPFMQDSQVAEYCSVCHKVHLDYPVNHYRWVRGFDDYDNWQASGVSGLGARSFYYPPKPENCVDCHMTDVRSNDAGNVDGFIHSHRFIAANTALPFVNGDKTQLDATEQFLKANKVRVDIFALSPETQPLTTKTAASMAYAGPQLETTFAVGEESENQIPTVATGETSLAPITAPLERVEGQVVPGESARVDVVVRTLGVGHFFPGGTVDAFDCWVELKATDDDGRVIFWSGMVEDHGRGPVEPGAHMYRSLSIDEHGNPILKRNAWAARATVYAHLIPPGAADTVHFRLHIPKDARGHIHLTAKVNYRKFTWLNTQFAFAGVFHATGPNQMTKDYDDRTMTFTGDTSEVAGKIKAIPNLPIVVMATSNVDLAVLPAGSPVPKARVDLEKADWQRWNDYGIGFLLQGDLKAAEAAFTRVTEIDPKNPDGWVNIGRVRVQEGNMAGARQVLDKALALAPKLARANYFYARVLRQDGDYNDAIARLRLVLAQYPEDRVVNDDLGRVLFLQHKYAQARDAFLETMTIDPEDLEANYNLMLCYTGLGNHKESAAYEERYLRFKADEASQTLTGPYREKHPDDNNERQPIHEHVSVPLDVANANNTPIKNTVASLAPASYAPHGGGN